MPTAAFASACTRARRTDLRLVKSRFSFRVLVGTRWQCGRGAAGAALAVGLAVEAGSDAALQRGRVPLTLADGTAVHGRTGCGDQ